MKERIEMKKIIILLVFAVILSSTKISIFADETHGLTQETIKLIDPYITNNGGLLEIQKERELQNKISVYDYELTKDYVHHVNILLLEEKIQVKENGSLYIASGENFVIQGGNINASRLYWWGVKQYNDNIKTKKIVSQIRKDGKQASSSTATLIMGLGFASLHAEKIGMIASGLSTFTGEKFTNFGKSLESKNKGYGTIISFNWSVVFGMKIDSQTKNTK